MIGNEPRLKMTSVARAQPYDRSVEDVERGDSHVLGALSSYSRDVPVVALGNMQAVNLSLWFLSLDRGCPQRALRARSTHWSLPRSAHKVWLLCCARRSELGAAPILRLGSCFTSRT